MATLNPDEVTRRALPVIRAGIERSVARRFFECWKQGWIAKLDQKRLAYNPKFILFGERSDGLPDWDPQGILNAIANYSSEWPKEISNKKGEKYQTHKLADRARSLAKTRNVDEHPTEQRKAQSSPFQAAAEFMTDALFLLRAFDARKRASRKWRHSWPN